MSLSDKEIVEGSGLFDAAWYLVNNPDVLATGLSPAEHYCRFGFRMGRAPSALFDSAGYYAANADLDPEHLNPLVHYETYGRKEGRSFLPRPSNGGLARDSGTIILVSHEAEIGGAPQVVLTFAEWLLASTKFDVKLVVMRGGVWAERFMNLAPTFNVAAEAANRTPENLAAALAEWAGPDVKAVFLNSVASGGFLKHWTSSTPVISFIHELPRIVSYFPEELRLIRERSATIIGGSEAVCEMLRREHAVEEARLGRVYGFIEKRAEADRIDLATKAAAKRAIGLKEDDVLIAASGLIHWRKSPEIFVDVAVRVIEAIGPSAKFMWVGGGPDMEACEKLAAERGLSDVFKVTGNVPDILPYLNACDVFVLSSVEDPFPLACLYAEMACAPVVCFEEAGGMPELVRRGCGRAVPFKDAAAMAQAVIEYARNSGRRLHDGTVGQSIVSRELTIAATGPQLLEYIRRAAGLKPHVSVVVPNYNCAPYLEDRLSSIDRQTFQDFELILLDDKSTDASLPILQEWAARRPAASLIINEKNSGSPFIQWLRGMELAKSDLIWMAEADDFCDPKLLESLVRSFEDRNVHLGYVKSVPVDAAGEVLGNYEGLYLNRIQPGRWSRSYVATDHEEANLGLGIANCIPNASSMMMRRFDPEPDFVAQVTSMRLCGDWYFYLRAMRGGLVAYTAKPYNFHRRHPQTVTSQTEGSLRYFDEFAVTRDYVSRTYRQSDAARAKIVDFMQQDLDRFGVQDAEMRRRVMEPLTAEWSGKASPAILIVISDLGAGGGQMFGIRLANELKNQGHRVVLFNVGKFPSNGSMIENIDPNVSIYEADTVFQNIQDVVRRYDIDLIHSSIWWADRYVQDALPHMPDVAWVTTLHGCYETLINDPGIDGSFKGRVKPLLARIDAWVYLTEKNRLVFEEYGKPKRELQIFNGVPASQTASMSRKALGLRDDSLVLCLVSRAIEQKGWLVAVEIVRRMNEQGGNVELLLVGDGPIAVELQRKQPSDVHLIGHVSNPQAYMSVADVGILPTNFIGESMPLVIAEFMALGKPVVSTDVGAIPAMLRQGESEGGVAVPLVGGEVDVDGTIAAIERYTDPGFRKKAGCAAHHLYGENFRLDRMAERYVDLYRDLTAMPDKA